ncbi:LVIVD repeat-containing protein [Hymenobacter jejuensis]|uniref:LVIVD repeat-containing protein n=1 Tax=Hymenobacter jejuensis TaxID=2502781 RepID=A0A5B7ZV18_9BACT|nr:hypothetical protein [Hymenobacter jejuensis]QDA58810.1 hypothetical protein FHG12_01265 [Hymenobacter jejuensis]
MIRIATYLLSCFLLLGLTACSTTDSDEPQPGIIDPGFASYYAYSYCPILIKHDVLEQSVASLAPRPMRNTGKIYLQGRYIFVNERFEGIHVIDNQDPAHPQIVSFLRIPGNIDMAMQDNLLYADNGPDLVTIDMTNPRAVHVTSRVRDAFRELPMPESLPLLPACAPNQRPTNTVVVGWQKVENKTAISPNNMDWSRMIMFNSSPLASASTGSAETAGKAGSLARFAVLGQTLYTVDNQSLRLFDLTDPTTPKAGPKVELRFGVETIFPQDHYLFLGTQLGMYIFDVAQPQTPVQVAFFQHIASCDPVVVDGRFAYVTLRSGNTCRRGSNELQVIDLTTLSQPRLARSYPMTGPQGLGVEGNRLFICDSDGLKTFDTSKAPELTPLQQFPVKVHDVIPDRTTLLAIGAEGLYQYSYDGPVLKQLSLLPISAN